MLFKVLKAQFLYSLGISDVIREQLQLQLRYKNLQSDSHAGTNF